jgi:hypothetical protein
VEAHRGVCRRVARRAAALHAGARHAGRVEPAAAARRAAKPATAAATHSAPSPSRHPRIHRAAAPPAPERIDIDEERALLRGVDAPHEARVALRSARRRAARAWRRSRGRERGGAPEHICWDPRAAPARAPAPRERLGIRTDRECGAARARVEEGGDVHRARPAEPRERE